MAGAARALFSGAVANGVTNTGTQATAAASVGNFDFAYAGGPNTQALAQGTLGLAVAQGSNVYAQAGTSSTDVGNAAFNIANDPSFFGFGNQVVAGGGLGGGGVGNVAANLGGIGDVSTLHSNYVQAIGSGNFATTVGGTGDQVFVGFGGGPSTLSTAFNVGGADNLVEAGPGPFNVAGLVNATGQTVVNNIH
jgi:hypothetical protein